MLDLTSLSMPTLAVLGICVLSFAYISINILLSCLATLGRFLASFWRATAGRLRVQKPSPSASSGSSIPTKAAEQQPSVSLKSLIKSSAKSKAGPSGPDRHADSDLFIATLRGHTDAVTGLAFSSDGKALATACEDRTLRVFDMTDPYQKYIPFRQFPLRQGARDVAFGSLPNQVAVLTAGIAGVAGLCTVDITGREAVVTSELASAFAGKNAQALCLRGSGGSGAAGCAPVLVAASTTPEMQVFLSPPGGGSLYSLSKVDTGGMTNYWAAVSNDGRFLAAATFASDVKVYEAEFDRQGACVGVRKAMDLKGHKKKVTSLEFSPDGQRMVTASEDGTLRLWTLEVRYKLQEDPKCLATVGLPSGKRAVTRLAWGRGGYTAAAAGSDLYILNSRTGEVIETILSAHSGDVTDVMWSPTKVEGPQGPITVLATAGIDGRVRLWRGPWTLA